MDKVGFVGLGTLDFQWRGVKHGWSLMVNDADPSRGAAGSITVGRLKSFAL